MTAGGPTLQSVRGNLERLREVAREVFSAHPEVMKAAWTLDDYLAGIDALEEAIERAEALPSATQERYEAEKYARNVLAVRLYFRGRLCLETGVIGRFYKKSGEKDVHWAPTKLSRIADRIAAEPLRLIYKQTESELGR